MTHSSHSLPVLENLVSSNLDVNAYDLERLAEWCHSYFPKYQSAVDFRNQLIYAIKHPGAVTPEQYQKWTNDDDFETPARLQEHLREIWNACFPSDAIG